MQVCLEKVYGSLMFVLQVEILNGSTAEFCIMLPRLHCCASWHLFCLHLTTSSMHRRHLCQWHWSISWEYH